MSYGNFEVKSAKIDKVYTHFDYIKAGTEIALIISTDFTASNNEPNFPDSLHYLNNPNN